MSSVISPGVQVREGGARTLPADPRRPLVGRDAELSVLRALVDPVPAASSVLVVLGDAGMGKTVLLADTAQQARSAGLRVLAVTGRESEANLAFSALHQLLRPVLASASGLPDRQAKALLGALGLAEDPGAPDRFLTGIAVLTLLSHVSEGTGVLIVADDAQWLDRSSLDALAFAGHRLDTEQVVLVLAARGTVPPTGFDRDTPELLLKPLPPSEAGRLLDQQPRPPRGRARRQVLAQAAGNPMALIELAKVIAANPTAGRYWDAEPLPLTDRLSAIFAHRFSALPQPTQAALLLAAVADGPDLSAAAGGTAGLEARALVPAEEMGLIKVVHGTRQFSHPLVRSAIYHSAAFADCAEAHRRMADKLNERPDRRAWHLAAAALQPDACVASLLEETAAQAQRRGGAAAAALALERSAELSPGKPQQARRLLAAGEVARHTGQSDWVQELAARALTLTTDPELRITARYLSGWALIWSNRHADALPALLSVAEQAPSRLPIAWSAIGLAATVPYHSGTPAARHAVLTTFSRMHEPPQQSADWAANLADSIPLWIRASTDPFRERGEL